MIYDYENSPVVLSHKLARALDITEGMDGIFFPVPDWAEISVIFPFAGAAARFIVRRRGDHSKRVSVYLDTKGVLGYADSPYWEAFPIAENNERFDYSDIDGLWAAIARELYNVG